MTPDRRTRPAPPPRPFDAAVVVPTVLRPTLERAVRSVLAQDFAGSVQVLVGVDAPLGDPGVLDRLRAAARPGRDLLVFAPGYSTSERHGGVHPARDGGALRTVLSYAAHSRLVAYLDDDNWWGPDHLATLVRAVEGRAWAYSLRWFVDPDTGRPLCVDRWDSAGPGAGCYKDRFGGWVDPNCLLVDKLACEPALRRWSVPLPGDPTRLTADRHVFDWLRRKPAGATGRATAFYTLTKSDPMYPTRMRWIAEDRVSSGRRGDDARPPGGPV